LGKEVEETDPLTNERRIMTYRELLEKTIIKKARGGDKEAAESLDSRGISWQK
jgi:hypothetical protein